GLAAAEGGPTRVVLVQTAGVGADRQTTIVSSSDPTPRVVEGDGRPESVLGARASRPAPGASARPAGGAGEPAPGGATGSSGGATGSTAGAAPERAAVHSEPLGPSDLGCVRDALGRAARSGLIPSGQGALGPTQIGWVAGQCDLDPAAVAPVLA